MTTYYLLATSGIFAVLFFVALGKLFQVDEYHEIQKEYISVCEERIKIGDELEEMRVNQVAHYDAHIRNQDAVMAQLTRENKSIIDDSATRINTLIKEQYTWRASFMDLIEQKLDLEEQVKDLEQANSIQAKAYQSLLNNNNKLHRELKLEQNNSNSWRASAIDWQSKYQELLREYGMDKLLPKNSTSGLDLKELESTLDKALERDFPTSDEYYDTITEINKGDVFLCVSNYGFVNSFNYYANEKYVSEKNQFITSHDGSPVQWGTESWQITANKHFKKLKPKK